MITNCSLTVYHKGFDNINKIETWQRFEYENAWWFEIKNSTNNKGYEDNSKVNVRIPYSSKPDVKNFAFGDLLVNGKTSLNINSELDLKDFEVYKISSITDNKTGTEPHIHLVGE